jgi:flagellar basal body P-ring protein FlgI
MRHWAVGVGLALAAVAVGCTKNQFRLPTGDNDKEPEVQTVGAVSTVWGARQVRVYGVGVVQGLAGTGATAQPGELRRQALRELKRRGVDKAEEFLAQPSVAVVVVSALIPPGARKGDPVDVAVELEATDQATSLRGGELLECDLCEMADAAQLSKSGATGALKGKILARAEGPILTNLADGGDKSVHRRGRVWGGGRVLHERNFALLLTADHQDVRTAKAVADRVNERFFGALTGAGHGGLRGMAEAKNNSGVSLRIHEAYRHNWPRFLRVVRQLPLREPTGGRVAYQKQLAEELLDPAKTVVAALKLEALGVDGAKAELRKGLESTSPLVRFCSAEALAYLGDPACAKPLAGLIREEPRFRAFGLTALASLDEAACRAELGQLLNEPSAECRYGAFRALFTLQANDPAIPGEFLNESFHLHQVAPEGPALVHLSTSFRAEVVVFGPSPELLPPFSLQAGPDFLLTANEDDPSRQCFIARISARTGVQRAACSTRLVDVIQQLGKLGATYPDVVELLQQASRGKNLSAPLAIDALPQAPSVFSLAQDGLEEGDGGDVEMGATPNLFTAPGKK